MPGTQKPEGGRSNDDLNRARAMAIASVIGVMIWIVIAVVAIA